MLGNLFFILALAIGLAMDAFAISISLGMSGVAKKVNDQFKTAFSFGFFQAFLFTLGFLSIFIFSSQFSSINKYIAAILLIFLGLKMIKESFSKEKGACPHNICLGMNCGNTKCTKTGQYRFLTIKLLLTYGVATSIDAFAAGISYGLLDIKKEIFLAAILIGVITYIFSFIGVIFGNKLKEVIGDNVNIIGGSILLILAVNSLF